MDVLIAFATTVGMTCDISERIGARLQEGGHHVRVAEIAELPRKLDVAQYDAVLVGGSVHTHGYQRRLHRFVARHLGVLQTRPSAFFSVCLSIASKSAAERAEAETTAQQWLQRLGWTPDAVEVIAGALRFSHYGLVRRIVMLSMARRMIGEHVESTRDYRLTDWQQVDEFARTFGGLALARAARAPGPYAPAV